MRNIRAVRIRKADQQTPCGAVDCPSSAEYRVIAHGVLVGRWCGAHTTVVMNHYRRQDVLFREPIDAKGERPEAGGRRSVTPV